MPQPAAEPAAPIPEPPAELDLRASPTATLPRAARSGGGPSPQAPGRSRGGVRGGRGSDDPWLRRGGTIRASGQSRGREVAGRDEHDRNANLAPRAYPWDAPEQPREVTEVATAAPALAPAGPRRRGAKESPTPQRSAGPAGGLYPAGEYQLASDQAFSPSFASAGTAMFF